MEKNIGKIKKAVVFDLDGTLLDTLPDIASNINDTLSHFGEPTRTDAEVKKIIGSGAKVLVRDAFKRPLGDEEFNERFSYFCSLYASSSNSKTKMFAGMKEVLSELKKRGYLLFVVTNKPQSATESVERTHFKDCGFDKIVGISDGVAPKPDPRATLKTLEEFGVSKENAYFVGDGDTDAMTAVNAGIKGISALWGYRDKETLQKAGATTFANAPSDLLGLIK